jgi:hypothetical protein
MHVGNIAFKEPGNLEDLALIDLGSTVEFQGLSPNEVSENIRKDAIYIAHTLMYLLTGERVYWHVKYRKEKAKEFPMNEIEKRMIGIGGNAIRFFKILNHSMTGQIIFDWIRKELLTIVKSFSGKVIH